MTGTMAGQKVVMCLASPFRDEAATRINQLIEHYNLAYVKALLDDHFQRLRRSARLLGQGT